eukprot:14376999-Alexandrium_andersonii.AAC.1
MRGGSPRRGATIHGLVAGVGRAAHLRCQERAGKMPIGGRWVDRNKGDGASHNVRSRYVAKDI